MESTFNAQSIPYETTHDRRIGKAVNHVQSGYEGKIEAYSHTVPG